MSNLQKPKLFITRKLPQAVEARAIESYHADLNLFDEIYSQKDLIDRLTRAETTPDALLVTVTDRIDRELIAALPASIRMIATFSVGYDQIDIKAASARGIAVSNTPDVLTDATADIALLLMLGAARGARGGEAAIRNAQWKNWAPTGYLGTHMTGKRLGIYGMGRIGRDLFKRVRQLGDCCRHLIGCGILLTGQFRCRARHILHRLTGIGNAVRLGIELIN